MPPFEDELKKILDDYDRVAKGANYDDLSDVLDDAATSTFQTRCVAAVERATGRGSVYFARVSRPRDSRAEHELRYLAIQIGVVRSLLHDIQHGYLRTFEELIHASLFTDFLEMAEYLASGGYKDAAAVIAGSTLEAHLRQLATKASVSVDAAGKPKKADLLNSELAAAGSYTKSDQKNVTAWLGLRNDAAHGNYAAYDQPRVRLLIDSIRHFVTTHPA